MRKLQSHMSNNMNLKLHINIRLYPTFVELDRNDMLCTIDNSVPHRAVLKTREYIRERGWVNTGYEEFKGEKAEAFNNAYRAAIQKLSTGNHTEESRVVNHFVKDSPDW